MTKRASIALSTLVAVGLGSACGSLLQGSRCNDDGSCGGGLVCDPVTITCVESLLADASVTTDAGADAGNAVLDAGVPDASTPDAGEEPDAGEPDAGTGLVSPPTRKCDADVWCRAELPARDGGWPQLTSVSGLDDTKIWVGGKGPTMLLWNGDAWTDRSAQLAAESTAASYPITEVNALSTNSTYVYWGGAVNGPTPASSCGWSNHYYDSYSFGSQSYCSGKAGVTWLGAHVDQEWANYNYAVAVGTGGTFYAYGSINYGTIDDGVETDFRAVHWRSANQIWIVGAAGEVRYKPLDASQSKDATDDRGFPEISNELYAVRVVDGALFVAGDGALYECDRVGTDEFPTLADCANALDAGSGLKIRGLAGESRDDMWAVGIDEKANPPQALLTVRTGRNQWTRATLPPAMAAVPLYAIWRYNGLTVVVGDNGAVFSKIGAP